MHLPDLPTFQTEAFTLVSFILLVMVVCGWRVLAVILRSMERNADKLVLALGEQRTWCAAGEDRLMERLADRDARLITLLTGHHEAQMERLAEVLRWVRLDEIGREADRAAEVAQAAQAAQAVVHKAGRRPRAAAAALKAREGG